MSNQFTVLQVEEEFEIDLNDAEPDFLKGQTQKTGGACALRMRAACWVSMLLAFLAQPAQGPVRKGGMCAERFPWSSSDASGVRVVLDRGLVGAWRRGCSR